MSDDRPILPPSEMLMTLADGWDQMLDNLSPAQVRLVRDMAVDMAAKSGAIVGADFLSGMVHGVSVAQQAIAAADSQTGLAWAEAWPMLLVGCIARQVIDGEIA